jgi:hypothetical protein
MVTAPCTLKQHRRIGSGREASPERLLGILVAERHHSDSLSLAGLARSESGLERELVIRTHDILDPLGPDHRGPIRKANACFGIWNSLHADDDIQDY